MNIVGKLIEGGQTWAHRMRMLRQVMKTALVISSCLSILVFIFLMLQINTILYQSAWYYTKAQVSGMYSGHVEINTSFWDRIANERHSSKTLLLDSRKVVTITEPYFYRFLGAFAGNLSITSTVSFTSFGGLVLFFFIRGSLSKRKHHVSGRKLSSPWKIALRLKLTGKASYIKIGSVPLVKGTETQHILITGGTGSGKTNCMHHIFPQIRKKGQRAIIVDTTGAFVARYYRPGKDFLLNPFDARSVAWSPWAECKNKADIEDLAECFIPSSNSDYEDYWRNASRALFSSLLQKTELTKKTTDLTRWILFEPLHKLCTYIQGTKGAAHIDINSEKTAASIRSVASSFLSCLEFLNDTSTPFSIHDWVQNKNDDSWLFLSCSTAQRASIRPLLSCWFSIATRSLIQMVPDFQRRIWFIIDELPSLNKLKDLEVFLTEGRKYGGCALLALQSISQVEAIYGREAAKTILGNCSSKIAFSEQDPETAAKISKFFGEREFKEYQEGLSYGAHEARDGVNLSLHTRTSPLISVTEIQSLKRNHAFLKLPENLPITKLKLNILY